MREASKIIAAKEGRIFDHAWDTAYMAIDRLEGEFLYCGGHRGKNILEFGCSFGVAAICLAAAAKEMTAAL